jgi:hypothetical protein
MIQKLYAVSLPCYFCLHELSSVIELGIIYEKYLIELEIAINQ